MFCIFVSWTYFFRFYKCENKFEQNEIVGGFFEEEKNTVTKDKSLAALSLSLNRVSKKWKKKQQIHWDVLRNSKNWNWVLDVQHNIYKEQTRKLFYWTKICHFPCFALNRRSVCVCVCRWFPTAIRLSLVVVSHLSIFFHIIIFVLYIFHVSHPPVNTFFSLSPRAFVSPLCKYL